MERSEPALVPGWLKGTSGGITGSGGNLHHFASSLQSGDHSVALTGRSRSTISSNDHDTPRSSTSMERTSSTYFRRSSSSNGHMMHDKDSRSYSSFGRSHRDRDREKDLDYRFGDRDYSDSLTVTSRIEKDSLRRSQSMISAKRAEMWPRRVGNGMGNGLLVGGSITSNVHKSAFERDFPSLGAEEKQGVPEVGRVSPPISSTASQSLPVGTSAVIGSDRWTSALVEIPVIVGSNSTALSPVQQTTPANLATVPPSTTTGLNMAETLAQVPSRARTIPQLSAETQRLEELALKQSRQLIPVTPSMPKTLALNSSEKPKPKATRSGELSTVTKVGSQTSTSQLGNLALRLPARSDPSKTPQVGKLHVLKGAREKNGASPTAKESPSPTNAGRALLGVAPSAAFAPLRSPNNPKLAADRKAAALSVMQSTSADRRLPSQARSDFFNSIRKKTSANHSAATPDASLMGPTISEKSDEQTTGFNVSVSDGKDAPTSASSLGCSTENGSGPGGNCDSSEEFEPCGEKNSSSDAVDLDQEEVEFLRSLGWEENAGEEALTEEEINAFYQETFAHH
ncbi:uncharacterized protein LOC131236464 isoform X2 [Magnolia sinica]|uniref:uncharacterized protein LOC131236464 isoform X2 n=1 Tax=Magnolia sinica TaxID=86752 RepID=UPI0026585F19|nr:uncharacterized protein LOC131236464 isoform X2 [Magnolia sinica]